MKEKVCHDGSLDYMAAEPNGPRFMSFKEAVARGKMLEPKVKQPAPRFHPKATIPEVPEGMQLAKFYGEPAIIPAKQEGDEMYGKSRFTVRQFEALMELERGRLRIARGGAVVRPLF